MAKLSLEEYITKQPDEVQKLLRELRSFIKKLVPEAEEKVGGWGIPAFVFVKHYIVQYAAFKSHIGFYPEPSGMEHFAVKLSNYKTSKGAVQFPLDKPLPWDLIEEIVLFKAEEKKNIIAETKNIPKIDFKKTQKELYSPKATPSIVDVPTMQFLMIDGKGDPNISQEYSTAVETLYGMTYTIKMNNKHILEYVIPPLEGLWQVDDPNYKGGGLPIEDKNKFTWTMMIRQPDFVTDKVFEEAKIHLAKRKPNLDLSKIRLETFTEGLCTQVMHIGAYDDEPKTVALLDKYAIDNDYETDMAGERRHHEIYISDPRKTAAEKLKTVIRHPIRRG